MAVITGTSGNDTLAGTNLADQIDGLAGNDLITDSAGSDTLLGGAGDDVIRITRIQDTNIVDPENLIINAGDGNDLVEISTPRFGAINIDVGAGNDIVRMNQYLGTATIATGAGSDRVIVGPGGYLNGAELAFIITDFTTGGGGDIFDFGRILSSVLIDWDQATNPFGIGFARLVQRGANVVLQFDPLGTNSSYFDYAQFNNTTVASFNGTNLGGYFRTGGAVTSITYNGTLNADTFEAGHGNDTVNGLGGDDALFGLNGNDRMYGNDGNDNINGDVGADEIFGDNGNDHLLGGLGNDTLSGGNDADVLNGGEGNDLVFGDDGNDLISGDPAGNDGLSGDAGDDVINVNRTFSFDAPHTTMLINAGIGNDIVNYRNERAGVSAINLGDGNDVLNLFSSQNGSTISLGAGADRVHLAYNITGSIGAIPGGGQPFGLITVSDFQAGNGGDVLGFVDALSAFAIGSWNGVTNPFATGHAILTQVGADVVLSFDFDGSGGGTGSGFVFEIAKLLNVTLATLTPANLGGVPRDGSAIVGQTINGTAGNDNLTGGLAGDTINGLDGDDIIDGANGNDVVRGGNGNDTLTGMRGADQVFGDAGSDVITDVGNEGGDLLNGGDGNDMIRMENYNGQRSRTDRVLGSHGDDTVAYGGFVNFGFTLTSLIDLGTGNDRLDILGLGNGNPLVTLGSGADLVTLGTDFAASWSGTVSGSQIIISDFIAGDTGDRIDFGVFALARAIDPFENFNPFAGGLWARLVQSGADVLLQYDQSGSASNFSTVVVFRNTTVSSFTDFNLGFDLDAALPPGVTKTGTANGDPLDGTNRDDFLYGLGGRDGLSGRNGNDLLDGGDDDDDLHGDFGDDTLIGGAGNDFITGGFGLDTINGGTGDDRIVVEDSLDTIDGGAGTDTVEFFFNPLGTTRSLIVNLANFQTTGSFTLGGNLVQNVENVQFVDGAGGDDSIFYGGNYTTVISLRGYTGNDALTSGNGADLLDGGTGDDVLVALGGNDQLFGDVGDDQLHGGAGNDLIVGGIDNDTIVGAAGNDDIDTGIGTDIVDAGAGDDVVLVRLTTGDTVNGGVGADRLRIFVDDDTVGLDLDFRNYITGGVIFSNGVAANITGFERFDIEFGSANDRVLFNDSFVQPLQLWGRVGNDTIAGGGGNDNIMGNEGNDVLTGNTGIDIISGDDGNDFINGGDGADNVSGGAGDDIVVFGPGLNTDTANGGTDFDVLRATGAGAQFQWSGGFELQGFELISDGGFANVMIVGTANNDFLSFSTFATEGRIIFDGRGGNDSLIGNSQANFLFGGDGDDNVIGDGGNDVLSGGAGADSLSGGDGDDVLDSGAGVDSLFGGDGNDLILFGAGLNADNVNGGLGADVLRATSAGAQFQWTGGSDLQAVETISSGGFADVSVVGTANDDFISLIGPGGNVRTDGSVAFNTLGGNDQIIGNDQANMFLGGGGNDRLVGNAGNDDLFGDTGEDSLSGDVGDDVLRGGGGNDELEGGIGNDRLDGGAGIDLVSYVNAVGRVIVDLARQGEAQNTRAGGFDMFFGIEGVIGSAFNDIVSGSSGNDRIFADAGNDGLYGGDGNDLLIGEEGADLLRGDAGIDSLDGGIGSDGLYGGTGDDFLSGNVDADRLYGEAGLDILNGGDGDDKLFGGTDADQLSGGAGVDTIDGEAGNDLIDGGFDADFLYGGDGNDTIFGGGGNDLLDGGAGTNNMDGGIGSDTYVVRSVGDRVNEAGADNAVDAVQSFIDYTLGATVERLVLLGSARAGTGNALNNNITGSVGGDTLSGLAGNDIINGREGDDIITGGAGIDALIGGAGADRFVIGQGDVSLAVGNVFDLIGDFSQAQADRIDLSGMDARRDVAGAPAVNDAFTFIGAAAFSNLAGQLRFVQANGNTFVYGDTDGNGVADFEIRLTGTVTLVEGDFFL